MSLSYAGGVANFSHTPANLHANYFGYNQNTALDAVYQFTLAKDAKISVTGGTFIGIYNKVLDFHPTAAIMPVAMTYDGTLTDEILLKGQYYMIVSGHNITTVEGTVEQLPAPSELVALSPVDGATEVAAPFEWRFGMRSFARYGGAKHTISDNLDYSPVGFNILFSLVFDNAVIFFRSGLTDMMKIKDLNGHNTNVYQMSLGFGFNFD